MERKLFPTGLFIELPRGYEAQIRPRSGLALKRGLTVLNTPGTIDADYSGEIGIITGVDARCGQLIGEQEQKENYVSFVKPLINMEVDAKEKKDLLKLVDALNNPNIINEII